MEVKDQRNPDLTKEYFLRLVPDFSIFDYIEYQYYHSGDNSAFEKGSNLSKNGLMYYSPERDMAEQTEIKFKRELLKVHKDDTIEIINDGRCIINIGSADNYNYYVVIVGNDYDSINIEHVNAIIGVAF